jgi:pilus assembly protein CpaC
MLVNAPAKPLPCVPTLLLLCAATIVAAGASATSVAAVSAATVANAAPPPAQSSELRCSGKAATPASMQLQLGKSTLMRLPEPVQSRSVGNPAVLQSMLVAADTLYLAGADIGSTNMIVQGKSGMCSVIEVMVVLDPSPLQATLRALLPEQKDLHVSAAADTLVLSGTVDDAATAGQAVELANAFVRRAAQPLHGQRSDYSAATALAPQAAPAGAAPTAASAPAPAASARVVNLLNVSAPQQVMLEVKVAEVSKSLLDKLEVGTALRMASGSWAANLVSNFLTGVPHSQLDVRRSVDGNHVTAAGENQDGLVRILAEPTVMAISGKEGSFLAGGRILIPVAQDNNKVTLEEKEFGVGLRFTPTVLAGGRINLQVAPEVSELSREGVGISATGFNGTSVLPLITTRRAATTVQLLDGQSFAIGGLIKNSQTSNIHAMPLLGEIPILGTLFRSTDFQNDRTELLFVVTAHLVKPLPPNYQLPTDRVTTPSRSELFLQGRMEGK